MTLQELEDLTMKIRSQSIAWLGGEAFENLERLINYTFALQANADKISALHSEGYRMVKVENEQR